MQSSNIQTTWTLRLRDIEMWSGKELPVQQRLTMHPAMIVLLEGEAGIERNNENIRMGKGAVCFCKSGSTYGIYGNGSSGASVAVLYFDVFQDPEPNGSLSLALAEPDGLFPEEAVSTGDSEARLILQCSAIREHIRHSDEFRRWRAQIDFQEMMYGILTAHRQNRKNDKTLALDEVKKYLEEHYNEEISVEQLAGMVELSPKYFAEVFKKTYGSGVMEYVARIRMDRAKQLMLGSDLLLREVAHSVGYKDEFYFSRKFKKEIGLSPSEYMKTRKNRIAVYCSTSVLGYLLPLQVIPYAAPLHPKWSRDYYQALAPVMPVHLSAFRQNHNKRENLDRLAEAQPELILCASGVEPWEMERLKEIAPVYELRDENIGWELQMAKLSEMLGKQEEMKRWLAEYRRMQTKVREALEQRQLKKLKILPLRLHLHHLCVNEGRGITEMLFETLGFTSSSLLSSQPPESDVPLGRLASCDADHLLLLIRQDTETLEYWKALQSSPEWLRLPAVRSGNVQLLPSYPWREYSPAANYRMLEMIYNHVTVKNP